MEKTPDLDATRDEARTVVRKADGSHGRIPAWRLDIGTVSADCVTRIRTAAK